MYCSLFFLFSLFFFLVIYRKRGPLLDDSTLVRAKFKCRNRECGRICAESTPSLHGKILGVGLGQMQIFISSLR